MFKALWHTIFYDPIYNGLVLLLDHIPTADIGISIIIVTVVVRLILFSLSVKAVRTQIIIKQIDPELKEIKKKYANDKQQQAQKTLQLYRDKNINPFSSTLFAFVQIPVIFALFWIFSRSGLPEINADILYSFVEIPKKVNMIFLGLIDMGGKSLILAILAGLTQFIQLRLSLPPMKERSENASLKEDFARSFQLQMRYVMPVFMGFAAYVFSAAVALYWLTSNLFTIGQEFVIKKRIREKAEKHE